MFSVCRLVVVACVATSVTVSVTASPATDALKQKLDDTNKEFEGIKKENGKLVKDIEVVENEIAKRLKEYESEKKSLTDKNEKTLLELEKLTFEMKILQILVQEKNETANYLKELSERVAFSLVISEEDVKVVKTRRANGKEQTCIRYEAENIKPPSKNAKLRIFSARSIEGDDTADILVILGEIDTARSRVFAAKQEREQLKYSLDQKKTLLKFKKGSWKKEIQNKEKTLKSNEEKVADLTTVITQLKKAIASLDGLIKKLKDAIEIDSLLWKENQKQLNTTFKRALACYKDIVPNTYTELFNYAAFLRRVKNPKSS